jgi:hypothetical protein
LRRMWRAAGNVLQNAESILFFGYSFPESDEAIIQLVQNAWSKSVAIRRVGIIDIDPDGVSSRLKKSIDRVADPSSPPVILTRFPVPADRSRPTWYQTLDDSTAEPVSATPN